MSAPSPSKELIDLIASLRALSSSDEVIAQAAVKQVMKEHVRVYTVKHRFDRMLLQSIHFAKDQLEAIEKRQAIYEIAAELEKQGCVFKSRGLETLTHITTEFSVKVWWQ